VCGTFLLAKEMHYVLWSCWLHAVAREGIWYKEKLTPRIYENYTNTLLVELENGL